jgi:beta-N-acetylhexosaminidase
MKTKSKQQNKIAGQRLMLGFDGLELNDELKHLIKDIGTGGLILFRRNIESPEQVRKLCMDCQSYAEASGTPPLFIAIDQEGGTVARLREPFTIFKGNPFVKTIEDAKNFAIITSLELKSIGVNMNFAPVLDVVPDGVDSIMKDRAFVGSPEQVSLLGTEMIKIFQENGIMAVGKHFPGIGRTVKDSHFVLPELESDFNTLADSDLIPFKAAQKIGVTGIMLSHILYTSLDKKWPASLSYTIARELLRERMQYNGLVMTDDLDMKAIEQDIETCMSRILACEIDIILICHKGPNIDKAFKSVKRLLAEDEKLSALNEKSVERILSYKTQFIF